MHQCTSTTVWCNESHSTQHTLHWNFTVYVCEINWNSHCIYETSHQSWFKTEWNLIFMKNRRQSAFVQVQQWIYIWRNKTGFMHNLIRDYTILMCKTTTSGGKWLTPNISNHLYLHSCGCINTNTPERYIPGKGITHNFFAVGTINPDIAHHK